MKKRLKTMLLALVAMMMPIGAWAYNEPESVPINIGTSGVATLYYGAHNLVIPEGVSASVITGVDVNEDGIVTVTEQPVDNIIPADCAVILRGESRSYEFDTEEDPVEVPESNLLRGTDEDTEIREGGYLYFYLPEDSESSDWIYVGNEVNNKAHKAYLALPVEEYSKLAAMLGALENPHLQHTHGGCEICNQVTEVSWGASADALTSYGTLAEAVAAAGEEDSNIGYIKLLADMESVEGIYVEGGNFTLDLNGHTISSEGHTLVIRNQSNVIIVDNPETKSGKVISSGEGSFAVGITNSASVTINGGTYENFNNIALYVQGDKSSVTINGGSYVNSYLPVEIAEGCSATITGGIFEYADNGAIRNFGNLVVKGGTFTYNGESFDAPYSTIDYFGGSIDFSDYPTEDISSIYVANQFEMDIVPGAETILLPEGYYFLGSDGTPVTILENNSSYCIGEEPAKYTITFVANGGGGEMEGEIIYEGDYTLPECTFETPEGMVFKAWQVGEDEENLYQPGEEITVTTDTEIKAVWTFVPQIVIKMSDSGENGWEGASITVKKDGVELDETVTIEDGTEATVTLVYDLDSRYTFYWNMGQDGGNSDGECEFEIIVNGELKYTGSGGDFSDDIEFFFALGDPFVVSFNANDGSGSMDDIETYESVTLPECTFTAPEGMMFDGWQVGNDEENLYQPGEEIPVTADTEIKAVWTEFVPQIIIKMHDSYEDGWHGDAIVVKKNGEEIGTATIENGADVIVRYEYDNTAEYAFYWQFAEGEGVRCPYECSFEIFIDDEEMFAAERDEEENTSDCETYENGELIHTIEAKEAAELESLTLVDGEPYSNTVPWTTVGTLTYTRTLPNLMWNALYVPFEIPLSELAENYDVAYINDIRSYDNDENGEIDDMTMEIIRINSGTLNANHPYLIRAKNEEAQNMEIVLSDATLYRTEENSLNCSSMYMEFTITGTYNTLSYEDLEEKYAISTSGAWQKLSEGSSLKPFRLYMEMTPRDGSPVKVEAAALSRIRINMQGEDGNTTGVEILEAPQSINDAVLYDLYGRKVTTPVKGGIYISNGKKVIVK